MQKLQGIHPTATYTTYAEYMRLRDADRAAATEVARIQGREDGIRVVRAILDELQRCHMEAIMQGPAGEIAYHSAAQITLASAIACAVDALDQAKIDFDRALETWRSLATVTVAPVES